jgi:hypothetical protein
MSLGSGSGRVSAPVQIFEEHETWSTLLFVGKNGNC